MAIPTLPTKTPNTLLLKIIRIFNLLEWRKADSNKNFMHDFHLPTNSNKKRLIPTKKHPIPTDINTIFYLYYYYYSHCHAVKFFACMFVVVLECWKPFFAKFF